MNDNPATEQPQKKLKVEDIKTIFTNGLNDEIKKNTLDALLTTNRNGDKLKDDELMDADKLQVVWQVFTIDNDKMQKFYKDYGYDKLWKAVHCGKGVPLRVFKCLIVLEVNDIPTYDRIFELFPSLKEMTKEDMLKHKIIVKMREYSLNNVAKEFMTRYGLIETK